MDLRHRLISSLGLLLGSLMTITILIQLHSLREDINAEVDASTRLVSVLLAAGTTPQGSESALNERLSEAQLRHLNIRTASQPAVTSDPHPLLAVLGLSHLDKGTQEVRIGDQILYVAANPSSEIDERLSDTVQIWITLFLYSGATLLIAWWSADRALRPVRALEDGLHRLARGEEQPALPSFALREFRRVAGAIEHLAQTLTEARSAQHALARQLISVQEDERRSLARELHDEMGQSLTALNTTAAYLARNAERLDVNAIAECASDLRRDIRSCGEQLRAMLKSLRPHGLDASGLSQTLRELIDGWRGRNTGIEFAAELPSPFPAVDDATALTIYRVVQEALTNVVRHSKARRCTLRITSADGRLQLEIEDDGNGMPQTGPVYGNGLLGMRERLEMAGGGLELHPVSGGGLHLIARLPMHAATEEAQGVLA